MLLENVMLAESIQLLFVVLNVVFTFAISVILKLQEMVQKR